jgi:hypothetical protein
MPCGLVCEFVGVLACVHMYVCNVCVSVLPVVWGCGVVCLVWCGVCMSVVDVSVSISVSVSVCTTCTHMCVSNMCVCMQ